MLAPLWLKDVPAPQRRRIRLANAGMDDDDNPVRFRSAGSFVPMAMRQTDNPVQSFGLASSELFGATEIKEIVDGP